jgi:hypothetical protein
MATSVISSYFPVTDGGEILVGARVFVLDVGTTNLKNIYSDQGLSVALTNPMTTDADGFHSQAYLSGAYKLRIETGGTATVGSGTLIRQWDNVDGGVPVGSGDLPVADGGTGASTAAAARTNLGTPSQTELDELSVQLAELAGTVGSTGATQIATGTTAQRPADLSEGQIRRNTTTTEWEGYNGSTWQNFVTESDAASQAEMEAATATNRYVTPAGMKNNPAVPKALLYVTYSAGVPTLVATSVNIAGITDNGSGDLSWTYTTALSAVGAAVPGAVDANVTVVTLTSHLTTGGRAIITNSAGANKDPTSVSIAIYGDL